MAGSSNERELRGLRDLQLDEPRCPHGKLPYGVIILLNALPNTYRFQSASNGSKFFEQNRDWTGIKEAKGAQVSGLYVFTRSYSLCELHSLLSFTLIH